MEKNLQNERLKDVEKVVFVDKDREVKEDDIVFYFVRVEIVEN